MEREKLQTIEKKNKYHIKNRTKNRSKFKNCGGQNLHFYSKFRKRIMFIKDEKLRESRKNSVNRIKKFRKNLKIAYEIPNKPY